MFLVAAAFLLTIIAAKPEPKWQSFFNGKNLDGWTVRGKACLLYTSDAADERSSVDLGGRRIIKK